jgi:hypothetical protein
VGLGGTRLGLAMERGRKHVRDRDRDAKTGTENTCKRNCKVN